MAVTKLIQVTNISPAISEEQMLTLFGFVGKIEAMCMYPSVQALEIAPNTPKICYIKFFDATCVGVSQYLTNTVFNDRALVVTPVNDGHIPDEDKAKEMAAQVGLPPAVTKLPDKPKSCIVNLIEGTPPNQVIVSHDPRLEELGLPKYPPLPASFEGPVIEEIRRTVLIIDINEKVTSKELIQCFEKAGDIKYMKFCSRSDNIRYALIEFTEQAHVIEALRMNGLKLKGKVMKVYHSTQAITKPETKSNEVAQREVVEALTRVKEAESLISAAIDPSLSLGKSKRGRSRSKSPRRFRRESRSRSRRRSRSRSHSRRRRASPRTRRSRSRSHHRKPKSKSPRRHRKSRSKSPTRTQRKSRSKSPTRTQRKSRSKSPIRTQRKSRSRSPRTKKKSRSKSPRTKRKSRSKSPSRSKRKSRSKSPPRTKKRSRTKSPLKPKRKTRSRSPRTKRRSHSRSPRSKYRSSSKSKTVSSKSALNRDKSKNPDKSPEKRSRSENDKKDKEKERDRNRDKTDIKRDRKDGNNRSRRNEKESDRKSKRKDLKNYENGEENGNYSSHIASGKLSHSDKKNLVLENGALDTYESELRIPTTSFDQTDVCNEDKQSFVVEDNLDVCTSENNISVLKGPNNDLKSERLNLMKDDSVFLTDLQCDSLAVESTPKQCVDYDESSSFIETSGRSRSRSHSPSDSRRPVFKNDTLVQSIT